MLGRERAQRGVQPQHVAVERGAGDSESSTGDVGPMGLPTLGSLVVLGDSISDGGGGAPFYYTLLHADLDAFYGDVQYVNVAQSGSETEALLGQVQDLPAARHRPRR